MISGKNEKRGIIKKWRLKGRAPLHCTGWPAISEMVIHKENPKGWEGDTFYEKENRSQSRWGSTCKSH